MKFPLFAALVALALVALISPKVDYKAQARSGTQAASPTPADISSQPSTPREIPLSAVPVVGHAIYGGVSPVLRDLPHVQSSTRIAQAWPARPIRTAATVSNTFDLQTTNNSDLLIRRASATGTMPAPLLTFDGISNIDGYVPSDSNGAVGPQHYVEMVNMQLAVYSKTNGSLLYGPVAINSLWSAVGGPCALTNDGDPIVLYDQLADRWLISEFSVSNPTGPYYECVAISTSPDPTSSYYAYAFQMPAVPGYLNGKFPDYPKLAIWPDAYYMTMNQFSSGTYTGTYAGAAVWALDRLQMLAGVVSPTYVYYDLNTVDARFGNMLPANLDGSTLPPTGSPGYFAEVDGTQGNWVFDAMRLWYFNVNWTTPASSTFGISGQPNAVIPVASFNYLPCVSSQSSSCIPQPNSAPALDAVGDRIMHRLVYRNFGNHEALVANHTVDAGSGIAGVRWYELRDPGGSPSIYQQGTYAPDTTYRWMGSIAMDQSGNIAIGYSASSASLYPSIRYAGRLATDPLGTLNMGEQTIISGTGAQLSSNARWGDYSSMSIDPVDDCTFWYVNQYYSVTGTSNWRTRIGSFRYPTCGSGTLTGIITDAVTTLPVPSAQVAVSSPDGVVTNTLTDVSGAYTLTLIGGIYTVTTSAYGYTPVSLGGINVTLSNTTSQNISLIPSPSYIVSGTISDSATGQPLTATMQVDGNPYDPPVTTMLTAAGGTYSVTLSGGQTYTFTVSSEFHPTQTRYIGLLESDLTEDFALWHQVLLMVVMRQ